MMTGYECQYLATRPRFCLDKHISQFPLQMITIWLMLRPDERSAWEGFLEASPLFAPEEIISWQGGQDPPDILCTTQSGKAIGVELTKWVEHGQITGASGRDLLEKSYLAIINSENMQRPEHIECVHLHHKYSRIAQKDAPTFRKQLFELLVIENAKPEPSPLNPMFSIPLGYRNKVRNWNTQSGAPINDFGAYPMLDKYLTDNWIFPHKGIMNCLEGEPWVNFGMRGGFYSPDGMILAAIDRIHSKIEKYEHEGIPAKYGLYEFDLLCFYCDEALLHNSPTSSVAFEFAKMADQVAHTIKNEPEVFNRIYLFHPYEASKVVQVYGGKPTLTKSKV